MRVALLFVLATFAVSVTFAHGLATDVDLGDASANTSAPGPPHFAPPTPAPGATSAPTPAPAPTPPTPAPPAPPAMGNGKKFGISTATFVSMCVVWLATCVVLNKVADKNAGGGGRVEKPYQPVTVPGSAGPNKI